MDNTRFAGMLWATFFQSSAHMIDNNQLWCVFSRAAIGGGVFTLMEQ